MSHVKTNTEGIAGEASRLKLNVYWLVDKSGSMVGSKIQQVNWAIKQVLPEMQRLESEERVTVYMSTIIFNDRADWHGSDQPVEISRFQWADVDAPGGSTSTAQAIELLCTALEPAKIGRRSCPPVCILLSDGHCTDSEDRYNEAIRRLNSHPWGAKAVRLSIGIGGQGSYNKAQLDQFISPYLRAEQRVETLPADTPRKLVEYILLSVTTALKKATSSIRSALIAPVMMSMDDLQNVAIVDPDILPDPTQVF
jgi:uncharacterized protein YegL